jgi:hypothetical protein
MTDLRLTATAHVDSNTLSLTYSVENQSDRDAYLLNRVYDNTLLPRPELAYVELLPTTRCVRVYKDVPPIPEGFRPVMPHFPYVTPLRAKQSLTETLHLGVPVREFRAYVPKAIDLHETRYQQLTFALGYYWSAPGMQEPVKALQDGVEVVVPRPPPGFRLEFGTLEASLQLTVGVLEPGQ